MSWRLIASRAGVVMVPIVVAIALLLPSPASAALPITSTPSLKLNRTIRTSPFVGTTTSMQDAEGSAYVARDDSLWLIDDNGRQAYEVNPTTGVLKSLITPTDFESATQLGVVPAKTAGSLRSGDLESMAYDPGTDTLYAFSGKCCSSSELPTSFRLRRGTDAKFHVESYQPLPTGSDFTAAGFNPADAKLYVGVSSDLRTYDYAANIIGPIFSVSGLSGILGMSFSDDGADLFVVTSAVKLFRVKWATRTLVSGWTFDLKPFGLLDTRAVELINDQFYVLDGYDSRPSGSPLAHAVFVLDVLGGATTAPVASFSASPTSGPAPLAVTFTDTSTGSPMSWQWDFGDSTTSTFQNPSHSYTTPGTYTVSLTATNTTGSSTSTRTGLVTVTGYRYLPTADSFVSRASPDRHYGSSSSLKVKAGSGEDRTLVQFTVPGPSTPTTAKLRMYVTNPSDSSGSCYLTDNLWTESGITWNLQPLTLSAQVAAPQTAPIGGWIEFDVSSAVTAGGTYSFELRSTSTDTVTYSSREGGHPPELIVTT